MCLQKLLMKADRNTERVFPCFLHACYEDCMSRFVSLDVIQIDSLSNQILLPLVGSWLSV